MATAPVYVEDEFSRKWDRCFTDGFLKFGNSGAAILMSTHTCYQAGVTALESGKECGGIVLGSVFSLLFFKRRAWPVILGAGFGTGMAWSNCEKEINAVLQLPAAGSSK